MVGDGEHTREDSEETLGTEASDLCAYEAAIVGLILQLSGATPEIIRILEDGAYFLDDRIRLIYEIALGLLREGKRPDLVTVVETLRERNLLDQTGGASYVSDLLTRGVDCCAGQYCAGVLRAHLRRTFEQALDRAYFCRQKGASTDDLLKMLAPAITAASGVTEAFGNLKVETIQQIYETAEPITWCVDKILPSNGIGILYGDAGIGKSWMALDLARAVATGASCFGKFVTIQGPVLYIDEDNGRDYMADRLRMLGVGQDAKCPLYFVVLRGMRLDTQEGLQALRGMIQQYHAKLVVIDPLSKVHGLDENSAPDMSKLMSPLSDLAKSEKCALLLLHHVRKNSPHMNQASQMMRGSTAIKAAPESTLYARRIQGNEIQVEHEKCRCGPRVLPFVIVMREDEGVLMITASDEEHTKTVEAERIIEKELVGAGQYVFRKNLDVACRARGIGGKTFGIALKTMKPRLKEKWLPAPGDSYGRKLKAFALIEKTESGERARPAGADFGRGDSKARAEGKRAALSHGQMLEE